MTAVPLVSFAETASSNQAGASGSASEYLIPNTSMASEENLSGYDDAQSGNYRDIDVSDDSDSLTPNVDPLTIDSTMAMVGESSMELYWDTNRDADSEIYYSAIAPVVIDAKSTTAVKAPNLSMHHSMIINGLLASTTYHLIIHSEDNSGAVTSTGALSMTTF